MLVRDRVYITGPRAGQVERVIIEEDPEPKINTLISIMAKNALKPTKQTEES